MQTELISKEVLIVWLSYCLIHKETAEEYPIAYKYSVALYPSDLRHLVLSQKDAFLTVCSYLQRNCHPAGNEIFSLREGKLDNTFEIASCIAAERDSAMFRLPVHQKEKVTSERNKNSHYEKILKQREQANLI
jgi:hypothetical protein